jgi:HK97 gp10 family phage protein
VWVENIDEINTITLQLEAAGGRIGQRGATVVKASALKVEALAKLFCPVDTGHLKSTIGPPRYSGDGRSGAMEAAISATADYARYVEWGTRNMAPRAFMGPALDRVGPEFAAACAAIADPFGGLSMAGVRSG